MLVTCLVYSSSADTQDMDIYESELQEVETMLASQRTSKKCKSKALEQNTISDIAANDYYSRSSKSTSRFAAKKTLFKKTL